MRNSFVKLLCAVSLCMMVSCMEKEDTPPHFVHVESVAFNVKDGKLTLPETHTCQLEIIFTPADCGSKKVTWSNTDGTVATVSPEGLITAKSEGVTVIGIQTDDMRRKAEVEVTVTPFVAENPITSITLDRDRIEYDYFDDAPDEPVALKATIVPAFPTISTLEWTSSDAAVATVDQSGLVTPVSHGRTVIRANAMDGSDQYAECVVTVKGIKDLNYDSGDPYYRKVYLPVNIEVTASDGSKVIQTWLDRNLGAEQVATGPKDWHAYGSLFQWSRKADGHEQMLWTEEGGTLVNAPAEPDARVADRTLTGNSFIPVSAAPWDWAIQSSTDEAGLWGGAGGANPDLTFAAPLDDPQQANNPCQAGYRVPNADEMYRMAGSMLGTTIPDNKNTAVEDLAQKFAECALHIPAPGFLAHNTGSLTTNGSTLWISTSGSPSSGVCNNARRLYYTDSSVATSPYYRARGGSVRCIRDTPLSTVSLEDPAE